MAAGKLFRKLDEGAYVAPQLAPGDFAAAAAAGVRTVVNNRPDGEEPGQLTSAEAERLARAAGLAYVHVPLANGAGLPREVTDAFAAAVDGSPGPVLAYCRSGTRSTYLWAVAAARRGGPGAVDGVVEAAARAGYDIAGARPLLEREAGGAQPAASRK